MKIDKLLSLFNLRKIELNLYETLFYEGILSASQLAKHIGVSRTSVYDLLERLMQIGLIIETQKGGVKMFVIQPPEKIHLLIKEKEKEITIAKNVLEELQKDYQNKQKTVKPQLQLFEGRNALQQMMKDMLLYRDVTVYAFWPIEKMISLLTPEFLSKFHKERISRNIRIKSLWPKNKIPSIKKYPFLRIESEFKREIRIAPKGVDFSLGYTIYGNTVRFLSSSKENFGFLVKSPELAEMMKSQFKVVWDSSELYKN